MNPAQNPVTTDSDRDDDSLDRLRSRLGLRDNPADGDAPVADDHDEVLPETERFAPESAGDLAVDDFQSKDCRVCGTDLRGHRRYKDSKGYLCRDCEREDRVRRQPCAECGKPTLPENLRAWGQVSICARCFTEHEHDPKSLVKKKISTKNFELAEKQNLLIVAGVAGVLLLIILLSWLGVIGG